MFKPPIPTVVFQNPDLVQNKQTKHKEAAQKKATSSEGITLDLKKARYEIMRMSAKETKNEDLETKMLLSLGAKPEKKVGVNYKQLQAERKKTKQVPEQEHASLKSKKKKAPTAKRKDKKFSKTSKPQK